MVELNKVQDALNAFPQSFKSLMIASKTKNDEPFSSYAPFVSVNNKYYFIISRMAAHYQNIKNNPVISILLLEDESQASHIFFRKRLSYLVNTTFTEEKEIKDAMLEKFGEFVNRLFQMDFVVVSCEILKGSFVIGAGQAYVIDKNQKVINQMTGNSKGHGHRKEEKS
jgi:putative heme iron utilization protein